MKQTDCPERNPWLNSVCPIVCGFASVKASRTPSHFSRSVQSIRIRLRDSEVRALQDLPCDIVTKLGQGVQNRRKSLPVVMGQQAHDIFEQQISRALLFCNAGDFKEQRPAGILKSLAPTCHRKTLAGKATADQVNVRYLCGDDGTDILPILLPHRIVHCLIRPPDIRVDFAVPDRHKEIAEMGKPRTEAPDPRE